MNPLIQRFLALIFFVQVAVVFPAGAEEIILHPDGVNSDAGWALSRVGEGFFAATTNSYAYPDTTVPVRLYLIDTAVRNPASFVAANSKLTFEGPILVRGSNDPQVSTPRDHGTQLLSLIAGVGTGIAPGTPIHVVNYDIYPNATSTISLLGDAISRAIEHHGHPNTPKMRSVICIATSSSNLAESYLVDDFIDMALDSGIPVILSAGNLGQDAAGIVPSSNGTKDGVICVGASDSTDAKVGNSNFGVPVDIFSPGDAVRTRSESATSSFVPMTGTSASAALVAGAVLAELSINGSLTPAQVEGAIKTSATNPVGGPGLLLRTPYASTVTINNPDGPVIPSTNPVPLAATAVPNASAAALDSGQNGVGMSASLDSDSDGIPDMIEMFHSGCFDKIPAPATISLTANQQVQFKFPIAFDLFRSSNPFSLSNGQTWSIRCTSDFKNWEVPIGCLSKTTDASGQTWLIATFPGGQSSCFARIEIVAP
jgi:hypothetical protein